MFQGEVARGRGGEWFGGGRGRGEAVYESGHRLHVASDEGVHDFHVFFF